MDLYHNEMSSCSQKVRLALAEKALLWNSIHLNLRAGDHQKPDLKLNPAQARAVQLRLHSLVCR